MLILTRRVGESLIIGDDVQVTVLGVKGNQVRIGVNAPKTLSVHREEIYERIKKEQALDKARLEGAAAALAGQSVIQQSDEDEYEDHDKDHNHNHDHDKDHDEV